MEKAKAYGAHSVFFEAERNGRPPVAQAFIFVSSDSDGDEEFAKLHKRLWSWGGVPLLYRKTRGLIQLFRCAHKPDFVSPAGELICKPIETLKTAAAINNSDAWWDASRLYNGTLWDDPKTCKAMLSSTKAAHKGLIDAVKQLNAELNEEGVLKEHLRRKLLILSLLIAYLEERGAFSTEYFGQFLTGATKFFHVLADGEALVELLDVLEERFNGHVFTFNDDDREALRTSTQLSRFARLVEGREDVGGQLTLWQLYSFKDLPVELISHIYQLFVKNSDSSVYTPPFLVRLMLEEALSWERLDRLQECNEVIMDPSCGSGVFLVEAYKRLVLHWRIRNDWKRPKKAVLARLLKKVHGIDLEEGAVELAAFSLCLALCDALEPEDLRSSIKLFPPLAGKTLHHSCFFDAKEQKLIKEPIGVVVGNPPFESKLSTSGAEKSYRKYKEAHGSLPDKQLAYLFLHEAMEMVAEGGVLSMLQQYNFLYNQRSLEFRRNFIAKWDVREILDFISIRGLFHKGGADTKVIVVVANATKPPEDRKILHATFRRSGRANAEQGFDIDYYDLHWLPRDLVLKNDGVWRSDLLGGGRVLGFVDRLKEFRTLGQFVENQEDWDCGEGFIVGKAGAVNKAPYITGKPLLETRHLKEDASLENLERFKVTDFISPRTAKRFISPMVLIHEHEDLTSRYFLEGAYVYKHKIAGICAPKVDANKIKNIASWLKKEKRTFQAFVTSGGMTTFTQKASWVGLNDIKALPYPENRDLDLSANEKIIVDDIIDHYRDLIRLGEDSIAMKESAHKALDSFADVFTQQINTIYKKKKMQSLAPQSWPGVICQPLVFGNGTVDWHGADELKDKLNGLFHKQRGTTLHVTRIARIYDGNFIFLLKPDRMRYWLRSIALRDADEVLADLRAQGF
ncbi:MAG: SAM-dependent methyltransferase [Alphaproteobacteria bacterium]|nr:MAG: SAM-dependent methyltransferase [Alphaproteobacteria bacterium]